MRLKVSESAHTNFLRHSGYRAVRSLFPITDGYKPEGKDGRTEGGPPSLPPSLTPAHVGREEEIMFIVLLVYQSPPLSFPVLILPGGGGVGFVNLMSPLSLEGAIFRGCPLNCLIIHHPSWSQLYVISQNTEWSHQTYPGNGSNCHTASACPNSRFIHFRVTFHVFNLYKFCKLSRGGYFACLN